MTAKIDRENCVSCGTCISSCPLAALSFNRESAVEVKEEVCISCGNCEAACPAEAISIR